MATEIAWGKKLTDPEKQSVLDVCRILKIQPDWLMTCMAFETGETFSPSIKNAAGSGATGLLQFIAPTAVSLGTTVYALAKMTFIEQMDYVEKYFKPYIGRMGSIDDVYMAILWPKAVGKPEDFVLFDETNITQYRAYIQNKGLDANKDGRVVKKEVCNKIHKMLAKGMTDTYRG